MATQNKYTLNDANKDITLFNTISDNLVNVNIDSIKRQAGYILEEACELECELDEVSASDAENILKETCDVVVTALGMMQKLSKAGFNVNEALRLVNENNLSKYPKADSGFDEETEYNINQLSHTIEFKEKLGVYVIKNRNGKVLKPSTYKEVDLSSCVPTNNIFSGADA